MEYNINCILILIKSTISTRSTNNDHLFKRNLNFFHINNITHYIESRPNQVLPPREGYVPVYIRVGDTPLEHINPSLAQAFHEPLPARKIVSDYEVSEIINLITVIVRCAIFLVDYLEQSVVDVIGDYIQ